MSDHPMRRSTDRPGHSTPIGFTKWQLFGFVVFVMVLAVLGSTYGSQFIVDSVTSTEVNQQVKDALLRSCANEEVSRLAAQDRRDREEKALVAQTDAFEAILNVTRAGIGQSPELDDLNVTLDRTTAALADLRVEVAKEIPPPNCGQLVKNLSN